MLRLESPLTEKRILFFALRKEMIGRRAYSDSVRLSRKHDAQGAFTRKRSHNDNETSSTKSSYSSSSSICSRD